MLRRKFLQSGLLFASAAGINKNITGNYIKVLNDEDSSFDKAKLALLSMQRKQKEQGMASLAFLDAGDSEVVVLIALETLYNIENSQGEDKSLILAEAVATGEAMLFAANETGNNAFRNNVNDITSLLLDKSQLAGENLYLYNKSKDVNVETIFLILPFLSAAGYPDEAYLQFKAIKQILYNDKKHLFYPDYNIGQNSVVTENFWGSGNGMAVAGLTRILRYMPNRMNEEKEELTEYLKEMIDGCLSYMRDDGLFYNTMDDPDSFVETNLSQMLAYSVFSNIYYGRLDFQYRLKADLMRKAANEKMDEHGLITDVCNLSDRKTPCWSAEGQTFYLLMESAANRLYK